MGLDGSFGAANATRGVTCSGAAALRFPSATEDMRDSFGFGGANVTRGLRESGPLAFGAGRCGLDGNLTAGSGGGVSWAGVGGR